MTALSVGSWFFEVMAFYLTLVGLGVDGALGHAVQGGVHPADRDAGGGGAADAGRAGRGGDGHHVAVATSCSTWSKSAATAGTLIVRIATLWFGVLLGW